LQGRGILITVHASTILSLWVSQPVSQEQMHLNFNVYDLEPPQKSALTYGPRLAEMQPIPEHQHILLRSATPHPSALPA
jgi:hypothetical protein